MRGFQAACLCWLLARGCASAERLFARIHTDPPGVRVYQMDSLAQPIYLGLSDRAPLELHPDVEASVHLAFGYDSPVWGPSSPEVSFAPESACVRQGWTVKDLPRPDMGPYRLPLAWRDRLLEAGRRYGWLPALLLVGLIGAWRRRPDRVRVLFAVEPAEAEVADLDGQVLGKANAPLWVDRRGLVDDLRLRLQSDGRQTLLECVPGHLLRGLRPGGQLRWPLEGTRALQAEGRTELAWELAVGETVDRYRIEARLGEGVSAVVYRVVDGAERLALKLMKPAAVRGLDSLPRFRREMSALGRLRHPNIPYLHDCGEFRGMLYLAMELLEGRDLSVEIGSMSLERCHSTLLQLARALEFAHQRGVLHRDVKPGNVMVADDGSVRLTDFGLARSTDSTTLTAEGTILGTPAYMAPEIVQGSAATASSDQYSLGCLAFEMVAGRPPFLGESQLAIVVQHTTAPVPSLAELRPDVPPQLAAVIARMLEKDPDRRFPGLADVVAALEAA